MMTSIYIPLLLISVGPIIFESTLPLTGTNSNGDRRWVTAILSNTHAFLVNPIITIIAILALLPQARETWSRSEPGSLSVDGLAAQAIVFAIAALYWPRRMTLSEDMGFFGWYFLVGWAAVDNFVFAFVQAVLWWISTRPRLSGSVENGETTSLIS
jgi:hypothetical protein